MFPKTLAIDFGTKKIGLAISYGTLAEPYGVILNSESTFTKIQETCNLEAVKQLLVGVSDGKSALQAEEFAASLQKFTDLPVFLTDETLSTASALEKIKEIKGKVYRGDDDHIAAANILQEWIDTNPGLS